MRTEPDDEQLPLDDMDKPEDGKHCVVLVTGGSGFLGQHVMGLLQEKADHVTELRMLDLLPYENKLDYKTRLPVRQYTGSITDLDLVERACQGVACVIHLVGFIDYSMFPDTQKLNEINVEGTKNVITACRRAGVQRLIYCSSSETAIGDCDIDGGTEESTVKPKKFLMEYGWSKYRAECAVLGANSPPLTTLCIRPVSLYGEGDEHLVAAGIRRVVRSKSRQFRKMNMGKGKQQFVYAGNAAWMFVCAEAALYRNMMYKTETGISTIGGHYFYACDDTPIISVAEFSAIFKEACGFTAKKRDIPGWVVKAVVALIFCFLSVVRIAFKANPRFGLPVLRLLSQTWWFRYDKAKTILNYSPLYTWHESKQKSLNYYLTLTKRS